MQLGAITAQRLVAALGAEARTLALEPGAELVVRVVSGPNGSGAGVISLAGVRLEARLPAEVRSGDTIRLVVVRATGDELVARVAREGGAAPSGASTAELAGQLALSGDGELLRGALALAGGGPLWLSGSRAAEVAVDADAGNDGERRGPGAGRASFVLHCPRLGAIEVHLAMDAGGVRAGVVAAPGEASSRAEAAVSELTDALARATGRPATADVRTRPAEKPAPRPPAGRIDARA